MHACVYVLQTSDHTSPVLYGYDGAVGRAEIIITEGELDKLALEEAGFANAVCGIPPSSVLPELHI